jgi:hypothetical protein
VSHLGVFLAGAGVTLIVTTALALLVVGAILDGRDEARRRAAARRPGHAASRENVKSITDRVPPHAA